MTRRPFLHIRTSGFDGDPCITAMWCDSAEYPDPAWVGHAVSQTVDGAFACLAARSAIRAQPASGDLLRSVLGELAERPGLIDRAALRCEHFAKGSEEDAANLYEWDKNFAANDFANERRANRIAHAAMCRQTAQLLRDLVTV